MKCAVHRDIAMAVRVSQVGHHRLSCRLAPYCHGCAPARSLRWAIIWADNLDMPIESPNMIACGRIRRGNVFGVGTSCLSAREQVGCGEALGRLITNSDIFFGFPSTSLPLISNPQLSLEHVAFIKDPEAEARPWQIHISLLAYQNPPGLVRPQPISRGINM